MVIAYVILFLVLARSTSLEIEVRWSKLKNKPLEDGENEDD